MLFELTSAKKISVIVPCQNERNFIETCINSILKTKYPIEQIEIIVADGMSDDGTMEILKEFTLRYSNIRIIENPKKITPAALNLGIQHANGNLILIASAHSSFPEDYIPVLVEKMFELNADVVGGIMHTKVRNSTLKSMAIAKVLSTKLGVGNSMFRIGVMKPKMVDTVPFGIYKREVFEDAGLYNESLIRNHDIELSKRIIKANKKIYLIPDISCNYFARDTFKGLALNNYRNGYWNMLTVYLTKMFSSLSLRHFIPMIFIISLIGPLFLLWISMFFSFIPVAVFGLYNLVIFYECIRLKDDSTRIYLLFFAFYSLHFSYGLGSLIGIFRLDKLLLKK
jgi:glycosyltransferase involved in cell wall biosynthesis